MWTTWASSGSFAASYATPVITGIAKESQALQTSGKEIITFTGTNFGPIAAKGAASLDGTFGPTTGEEFQLSRSAGWAGCSVTIANTQMQCVLACDVIDLHPISTNLAYVSNLSILLSSTLV